MTEIAIIAAQPEHAIAMASRLRAADVDEIYASRGLAPEPALLSSLERSTQSWVALVDGVPACLWGVGPLSLVLGKGCPWLLGTCEVERHARTFLRLSRVFLREMQATYPELENVVDARHRVSLRWLGWLGFAIDPAQPMGFLKLPFHRFHMGQGG